MIGRICLSDDLQVKDLHPSIQKYSLLIYLLKCVLHQVKPDEALIQGADMGELYRLGRFHGVSVMTAAALLQTKAVRDSAMRAEWSEIYYRAIRRDLLLKKETDRVCETLSKAGIRHVRLKGSVLSRFYPKPFLREMKDVDLLSEPDKAPMAKSLMESLGYQADEYGVCHHDVYIKPPIYCMELHNELFSATNTLYHDYFVLIRNRLIPCENDPCEATLSDEDFYLFVLAHACKHLHNAGIGLRVLTDLYVCGQKLSLDRACLDAELEKLALSKDDRILNSLAKKLFSDPESAQLPSFTEEEENVLVFMLESGQDGSLEHRIANRTPQAIYRGDQNVLKNKVLYINERLFKKPVNKTLHPFIYRHKAARPLLVFARLGDSFLHRRGKLKKEMRAVFKMAPHRTSDKESK